MNARSTFRSIAKAALAADTRMQGFTQLSAWAGNISAESLPVLGVVTPQERIADGTLDCFQRAALLQIVVKRLGGDDLEDVLDLDADAIEVAVLAGFRAQGLHCMPEEVTMTLNGEGEQKVGTLVFTFRVTYLRAI
jgi:hypothetical protein